MDDSDVFMLITKWVGGPLLVAGWVLLLWLPLNDKRQGKKPDESYAVVRFIFGFTTLGYIGLFFLKDGHDFFQGFLFGLQVALAVVFLWKVVPLLRKRLRESARQAAGVGSEEGHPSGAE